MAEMIGMVGKGSPAANVVTQLCTIPAAGVFNVNLVNCGEMDAQVSLAFTNGAAPINADYIERKWTLAPAEVLERTGIACNAGERVYVECSTADVGIRVHGTWRT
jgi:hypothetical protein